MKVRGAGARWSAVVVACLVTVGIVSAEDLVSNGTFELGQAGWTVGYAPHGTLDYSEVDAQGSATSGSALLTNISTAPWGSFWVWQCVPVSAGEFDLGAQVMVPFGQGTNGNISVAVQWYGMASCEGTSVSAEATAVLNPDVTGTWRWTTATFFSPPPGTVSGRVSLQLSKEQDSGSLGVHFDNVYLGTAGGIGELFSDGFESGDVSAWP